MALLYSLTPAIGLLTPNPCMPDPHARVSHLIELLLSNFVFGSLVTVVLPVRPDRKVAMVTGEAAS